MASTQHHVEVEEALYMDGNALNNPKYDIYTGSNAGFLKGILVSSKTFANINCIKTPSKDLEVSCMCWGNHEESSVVVGCRGGSVYDYNFSDGTVMNLNIPNRVDAGRLKDLRKFDSTVIAAYSDGIIKCFSSQTKRQSRSAPFHYKSEEACEIRTLGKTGVNLNCMDHSNWASNSIATGGKENPLKIWDISRPENPTFTAKNVKNDWLNLRVPVWVTKALFQENSTKVITGTGLSQIRLYDPSTPKKRPVIEVKFLENPISAMCLRPNSDFHIFAGNTIGSLGLIDLRKKAVVKTFKGTRGGITDIKCHPEYSVFAACSVDRYVYCYDSDRTNNLISSIYTNSQLNCLLFSSVWSLNDNDPDLAALGGKRKSSEAFGESTEHSDGMNEVQKDSESSDGEDVWEKMEVVKSKKLRKTESKMKSKKREAL